MGGLFLTSRRHWWERVNNTVIEFHLSETSRSCRAQTQTARLIDRDANDCAISPPRERNWKISYIVQPITHVMGC